MSRFVVPLAVLLVALLLLPGGAWAGDDEMPAPARVAAWVLSGDDADLKRAVHALAGAPPAYVAAVIRHVRQLRPAPAQPSSTQAQDEPLAVLLESRVYSVPRGTAKTLLGERRMPGAHLLDDGVVEVLRGTLDSMPGAKALNAPSIVVADREWATLELCEPLSYVKSIRAEVQGGVTVPQPVIEIIKEGLAFDLRPMVSEDRKYVTLAGALTRTSVDRPIPTQTGEFDGGVSGEVQSPVIQTSRLDLHITVPDGGTVAGTGWADPANAEREQIVLLTVQRVSDAEVPTEPPLGERTRVITMEIRLLRLEAGAALRILGDALPDSEVPVRSVDAATVVHLLGPGRRGAPGVEIVTAPIITTYDGQRANVTVLNQVSYVKDYTVHKSGENVVLDPVIDTLQDGLVMEVTPTINADRTGVAFETLTTWAVLTRPIARFETTIEGQGVTVEIPELRVNRVRETFDLQAGGYALIGGFDPDPDGGRTCVLLHASVTDLEAVELKFLGEELDLTPR